MFSMLYIVAFTKTITLIHTAAGEHAGKVGFLKKYLITSCARGPCGIRNGKKYPMSFHMVQALIFALYQVV